MFQDQPNPRVASGECAAGRGGRQWQAIFSQTCCFHIQSRGGADPAEERLRYPGSQSQYIDYSITSCSKQIHIFPCSYVLKWVYFSAELFVIYQLSLALFSLTQWLIFLIQFDNLDTKICTHINMYYSTKQSHTKRLHTLIKYI